MAPGKRNFVLVWLNNFVTAAGMMAFLPLLPLYVRELGVTDESAVRIWSGVLVAGAPLTAAFMGPVWGAIGDRIGRKPMVVRANLAIVLFVGAMAFVTAPLQLFLLRLGQGVFSGFMAPSVTLVSVTAPPEQQGRVTGLLHTAVIAGSMCGPVVGGFVSDHFDFRTVFLGCAALSFVAGTLVALGVREPPREVPLEAGAKRPAALLASIRDDVATFLAPGPLRSLLVVIFAVRFGVAMVEPIMALYVESLAGARVALLGTTTGLVVGSAGLSTLLFSAWWGRFGDRGGHGRVLVFCATGAALFYALQGLATTVWPLYPLRFLAGACLAGTFPAAYAMAARHSSKDRRGGALGFVFSALILANAVGPISGGVLAASLGLRPMFFVAAGLLGLAALRSALRVGRMRALPEAS